MTESNCPLAIPTELSACLAWLLAADAHAVVVAVDRQLAVARLGMRTFAVLAAVAEHPALTQLELARQVGLDKTTMVATLDILTREGWLTRRFGTDRRTRVIELTAAGRRALTRGHKIVAAAETAALAGLAPSEAARLRALLGRLNRTLTAAASPGSCV